MLRLTINGAENLRWCEVGAVTFRVALFNLSFKLTSTTLGQEKNLRLNARQSDVIVWVGSGAQFFKLECPRGDSNWPNLKCQSRTTEVSSQDDLPLIAPHTRALFRVWDKARGVDGREKQNEEEEDVEEEEEEEEAEECMSRPLLCI
ncbi:unnamed protein product [Hydatigera taeniaeformis]|uniref:CS domain-containing protein n=1 Tax=Hydatigena taeniaeformis TaxID=6205 RepID=A0A0R3X603_HYDTA|nr:unnamed protein product [Hydatigera taeniaeformis]